MQGSDDLSRDDEVMSLQGAALADIIEALSAVIDKQEPDQREPTERALERAQVARGIYVELIRKIGGRSDENGG